MKLSMAVLEAQRPEITGEFPEANHGLRLHSRRICQETSRQGGDGGVHSRGALVEI